MRIASLNERINYSNKFAFNRNISMCGAETILKKTPFFKKNDSKFLKAVKKSLTDYCSRINYTWQHKKAFLDVERELCGKNSVSAFFHDTDKLFMYIIGIPQETAHNIHVRFAPHHVHNAHVKKPVMAVIDWECARYTKADKPLSARKFYEKFYVEEKNIRIPEIEEVLDKLGL